jgi:hypothetical protein
MTVRRLRKAALAAGRRVAKVIYVKDRLVNVVLARE